MNKFKTFIKSIPILGPLAKKLFGKPNPGNEAFPGSAEYWEDRYAQGGNSGSGSYSRLAEFKAEVINGFVEAKGIQTVVELGCGDGNQLTLAKYPEYTGIDVSQSAINHCNRLFAADDSKSFVVTSPSALKTTADLAISLDVLFHLIEENVFESYLEDLFRMGQKYVIIYSSNFEKEQTFHEKDRKFTDWVEANISGWVLIDHIPNRYPFDLELPSQTSKADFFFYEKEN